MRNATSATSTGRRSRSRFAGAVMVLVTALVASVLSIVVVPSAGATPAVTAAAPQTSRLTKLVAMARSMTSMDIPYSSGGHGTSPAPIGASVDCSGLVRQLYDYAFGVDIGRGTGDSMVRTSGKFVRTSDPVPGDVILFGHGGSGPAYHLMIYVGVQDGQRLAVASPTWGETVEYQHPASSYWAGELMGYWHYKGATAADSDPLGTHVDVTSRTQDGSLVTLKGTAYDSAAPSTPVKVSLYLAGALDKSTTTTTSGRFTLAFRADGGGHGAKIIAYPVAGSGSVKASTGSCAPFPDVQSANQHCWNITWLADKGVTKPASGKYDPAGAVTRGAMAAFLFRIVHPDKTAPSCTSRPFPDVPTTNQFCGYIAWAGKNDVALGYPDGRYRPGNVVTRGAMAAFLNRIASNSPAPRCTSQPFTDVPTGSTFCRVIAWAKAHGITYGTGGGTYGAGEPVSRQSMASFLRRIASLV